MSVALLNFNYLWHELKENIWTLWFGIDLLYQQWRRSFNGLKSFLKWLSYFQTPVFSWGCMYFLNCHTVEVFWGGQMKSLSFFCSFQELLKEKGWFGQILWPSQIIGTLSTCENAEIENASSLGVSTHCGSTPFHSL